MAFSLGFIGGGNMSTAIAKGILKHDTHPASKIWVSGPRSDHLAHWKEMGTNVTTKNGEVLVNCDIIFLGVKPSMLRAAIQDCLSTLTVSRSCKCVLLVSMLAGVSLEVLEKELKVLSKDMKVVRIMPNTPMTVGVGSCLYTPGPDVTTEECATLERLLNSCGITEQVPEPLMDSLGVLTACGPAYVYIIIEALADGAVKQGVPRAQALRFAAQMVAGSAQMVLQTGKHPGLLKDEVCSPGGSTICGVTALEDGKIRSTLINAIEASVKRTKDMGK